jgi:hypothetical protein
VIGEACPTGNCFVSSTPIPNGSHGISFRDGAHDNTVGPRPSDPATLGVFSAHNHGAGAALDAGYAADDRNLVRILSYANDHLGIDVADTSCVPQPSCRFGTVTPLFPDSAFTSSLFCPGCGPGGTLVQTGYVHGYTPNQTVASDIAINDTCDPSGYGQAQHTFLGSSFYSAPNSFVADANGDLSVAASVVGPTTDGGVGPSGANLVGKSAVAVVYLPDFTTGEYSNCVTVKLDGDGDGIEDSLDPAPALFSDVFDSRPLGGTAYGTIVARNNCYVSVVPLPVITDGGTIGVVCPNNPGGQAQVSVCGIGKLTISDGQSVTGNCASLDTKVAFGPVTVTFGGFTATLPTGTTSSISPDPTVPREYVVRNDPASAAPIVAGGHSVAPGASVTLSPPPGVGGIAEQPDVASLPSAASSGPDYTAYVLGAFIVLIVAAAGAVGWRKWRHGLERFQQR